MSPQVRSCPIHADSGFLWACFESIRFAELIVLERQVQATIHFCPFPEGRTCPTNMFKLFLRIGGNTNPKGPQANCIAMFSASNSSTHSICQDSLNSHHRPHNLTSHSKATIPKSLWLLPSLLYYMGCLKKVFPNPPTGHHVHIHITVWQHRSYTHHHLLQCLAKTLQSLVISPKLHQVVHPCQASDGANIHHQQEDDGDSHQDTWARCKWHLCSTFHALTQHAASRPYYMF